MRVVGPQQVFDPGSDEEVEVEEQRVAHVVQKLMDLDELMPRSSWAHLLFEQEAALGQTGTASETGVLTVLAHVDSANDRRKDSVVTSIQNSSQLAAYDDMEDRSSSQRGQNKDARRDVVSAPSGAADPVA